MLFFLHGDTGQGTETACCLPAVRRLYHGGGIARTGVWLINYEKEIFMKLNMGTVDRIIRALVAGVVAVLYFTNQITGTAAIILGVLAIVFLLTSLVGFCPLYLPLGLSTRKSA